MDYYENKGVASAQLEWLVPGTAAKIIQVVPTAQLLSSSYGLLGTYYNNMTLTSNSATYSEIDADVNFNWGSKPPKTGFPSTHWSASWSGEIIPPTTGTYSFYVNTDDGSRLILNGQELINDWHDHSAGHVKSATIHLTGGQPYRIKMQYYQDKGVASAQLEYSGPAIPVMTIPTQVMLDK
jgi:hypothetical protein